MEPGIYTDLSNEDYHKGGGLSASGLKRLSRSPEHFKKSITKETDAMRIGTATHCAVFEPERFAVEYIAPDHPLNRATQEGKAEWAELLETGKIVLKQEEYRDILNIAESVRRNALSRILVEGGIAEQSVYWKQTVQWGEDEETKILCKCRPDYVKQLDEGYLVIDLKTTQDARPNKFERSSYWDYGYHIQAAHYTTGMTAAVGIPPRDFIFIAVETAPPYGVSVYQSSRSFLNRGIEENDALYKVYARCMREGAWPGYPEMMHELELPRGA